MILGYKLDQYIVYSVGIWTYYLTIAGNTLLAELQEHCKLNGTCQNNI